MNREPVFFNDLGRMDYAEAWDFQEQLLQENVKVKAEARLAGRDAASSSTKSHLLFVEHPPVYTLGKSGLASHVLLTETERNARGILFFHTNRGGDITYHGPGQIVGYPILDLEKFGTDIGKYLRNLEEVIIRTLADYGLRGERSKGETGVWIDPGVPGRERKIAALGVRCSRWITMHGFALNVNTDLSYFDGIIPCGIRNKQVSSLAVECAGPQDVNLVKSNLKKHFEAVFETTLQAWPWQDTRPCTTAAC
jgi:lipoyl(octanoyl) transferase